jgi:DNA-binding winged helix-turn-helix (wHTH) protein/tetratricopeptide (TPR) repeat protein
MSAQEYDGLAAPGRVVLAHELPFRLGDLEVVPATRTVVCGDRSETLEPRVMQVLVVLARANGAVVTRERLIELCWEGRVVTDDAVNRILSRIRHVAAGTGAGSFRLETIARVGYRLTKVAGRAADPAPERSEVPASGRRAAPSRRTFLVGAGAVLLAGAAGGLAWRRSRKHVPSAEARQLYERGALLAREALPGQMRQSISYLEQAVRVDPQFGAAWGALALGYSHLIGNATDMEPGSLPDRIAGAAARAFELDPGNPDATLALISLEPAFRNWGRKERRLRTLVQQHPRHWLAHGRLAMLLYQVGRLSEGIAAHRRALAIEPMLPIAYAGLVRNLSALGRVQEADATVERARQLWPAHPVVWFATYDHLLHSGRPRAAAGFAANADALPSGFGPQQVEPRVRLARAVETGAPADVDATLAELVPLAQSQVLATPLVAPALALLGKSDLVFECIERYLLGSGASGPAAPHTATADRSTDVLFSRPLAPLRTDARFATLLHRVGLDDYWRAAGATPDYRRPSA